MKLKVTLASLMMLSLPQLFAKDIHELKTEFMDNPISIDVSHPRFSWKMASDGYGASQTAYRIMMADSPENLKAGKLVYDSGKIDGVNSVNIRYNGDALKPMTRYYWNVMVWDEDGKPITSKPHWFETGLLGYDWHNAQWIGSKNIDLSPYRSRFTIDYDFATTPGNNVANFIFGGKSDTQYVEVGFDTSSHTMNIKRMLDGKLTQEFSEPVEGLSTGKHHVSIDVMGPHSYSMHISVDGKKVKNSKVDPNASGPMMWGAPDEYEFSFSNDSKLEPNSNNRLYQIGFSQPKGKNATFSDITITENAWNTILYSDKEEHNITGNGKPVMWQPGKEYGAPMLRKSVKVEKPLKKARLYSTARGVYEFEINGDKVGADYLNPGWTDFRKRIMYNTYDITPMLTEGNNGIGATLGKGWFTDHMGFNAQWQDQYGVEPSLMAMIVLEYNDGTKEYIVTDGFWKCSDAGPILENSLFNGEDYDARREIKGWSTAEFNDASWDDAEIKTPPSQSVILQGYVGSPIRNNVTLTAKSVKKVGPKEYIYDMGQNLAGVPRIEGMKGKPGQEVTFHFAEMLYPDIIPTNPVAPYTIKEYKEKKGQLYRENYRSALSTDRYIMKGTQEGESYEPRFTYHGYRYISIEGLDEPLPLDSVKGLALESIGNQMSDFKTSNDDINQLFSNCVWGQRGNFLAVPTDCPQRDERMGWTGDAQVFARAATYNMNIDPFYTRWLYTLRDDQASTGAYDGYYPLLGTPGQGGASRYGNMACGGWMEVGVIVPWQMYQQYGDIGILEQQYPSMVDFIDYLERNATDYVQPFGGTGDWLAPVSTNTSLTNTCYAAYVADIMSKIATVLGKEDDSRRFSTFYNNIKHAFNRTFINSDGITVIPDKGKDPFDPWQAFAPGWQNQDPQKDAAGNIIVDTQTSYVLPLQFGLLEGEIKDKAVENLHKALERSGYTLTTGFVGTPYICLVLSDNGKRDDAYALFTQDQFPSWLFPVKQGATTFWERWNSYTIENGFGPVSMNSFNHYAYGAIEEWMMSHCLGIEHDETAPGYKHFFLQPEFDGRLDFAEGGFETMYGPVKSSWRKQKGKYVCEMTVPANTTATVTLPGHSSKVVKGKEGVISSAATDNKYEVASGSYQFEVSL